MSPGLSPSTQQIAPILLLLPVKYSYTKWKHALECLLLAGCLDSGYKRASGLPESRRDDGVSGSQLQRRELMLLGDHEPAFGFDVEGEC